MKMSFSVLKTKVVEQITISPHGAQYCLNIVTVASDSQFITMTYIPSTKSGVPVPYVPPTKTGVPVLDDVLQGGFPAKRAMLVTGGPGTGKTTFAMQFLDAGLSRGERCLFVSTEQTPAELRDSFAPYQFDIDNDNLAVATLHATPGQTLEAPGQTLTLATLDDGVTPDEAAPSFGDYRNPFTAENVSEFLKGFAPADRVVFDSISGLAVMTDNERTYKRTILDVIRVLTDTLGATTVLTAESGSFNSSDVSESLHYCTHGVIELTREMVEGDYHRFLQVKKMRGVEHDTRRFEMEFDAHGIHLLPRSRTPPMLSTDRQMLGTGITGLDTLCGGGLVQGGTVLLEHDGRAYVDAIIANVITQAIREGEAIVLVPPSGLTPAHLDNLIAERVGTVRQLLADNQLFVLDLTESWRGLGENVYSISDTEQRIRTLIGDPKPLLGWKMKRIFGQMNERRGAQSALAVVFTEALLQEFDPEDVRQMYYWARKTLFVPEDTVMFVQNPAVMDGKLAASFVYDSQQMLRTWMHDAGLQYIKLEKSPTGHLASTSLVEHVDYPPYVRIQRPAGAKTVVARTPKRFANHRTTYDHIAYPVQ